MRVPFEVVWEGYQEVKNGWMDVLRLECKVELSLSPSLSTTSLSVY